jgi:hypothetical protein
MSRTGDQSLSTLNGDGDMASALAHAIELENKGIVPYVIDEEGYFKSNKVYPRICAFTKEPMIPVLGDTLLEVRSDNTIPRLNYNSYRQNFSIVGKSDKTTQAFDDGQPISGQSYQPFIDNIEACKGVYATFEVYGSKYRKMLIDYRDKTKDEHGVKLKYDGMKFQTFGCNCNGNMYENNIIII